MLLRWLAVVGLLVLGLWVAWHQEPPFEDLRWPSTPSRHHCWGKAPREAGCK